MSGWPSVRLGDLIEVKGGKRLPKGHALQGSDNGAPYIRIVDINEGNVVEANLAFVPEETQPFIDRYRVATGDVFISIVGTVGVVAPILRSLDGAFLTENAARLVASNPNLSSTFLRYFLASDSGQHAIREQTVGSTQPKLALGRIKDIAISLPPVDVQTAIVEVLGAIEDKIATNSRIAATSATFSRAIFEEALQKGAVELLLSDITTLVSRGITPAYSEASEGTTVILNQKCVRDQRVLLSPSRRTLESKVLRDKMLVLNDVLVNSTGQGTLGRVARWTRDERVTTDSHISIVRFDASVTNPVTAGYGLMRAQPTIEELGEGSTGQTELSRVDLGNLHVLLPTRELQDLLGERLSELSRTEDAVLTENEMLVGIRDALLPQLMSGKLRVRDAEKSLAGVL
ncbi:restriction endonuclease subunit S [Cryobacterium sp. PH31-O1]|uniref:restriction endonuclease subunit S n=1 Tax=Cryobacterium sp. PH31-O1 TaxID=3046306 RepID=UPI0024BA7D4A|nr:restriction endonuclease subunit S [Cryobacterium sp. PH31-O1]MDJ0337930.1 restriction endonuclease subunit S [Cryobacterium sp. PH31-O1]